MSIAIKPFDYCFFGSLDTLRLGAGSGTGAIVPNLERMIVNRLGFGPKYPPYDTRAFEDKNCVVISVNPSPENIRLWDDRWIGVNVGNGADPSNCNIANCRFYLEPSYLPYSPTQKAKFKSDAVLYPIQILPGRLTPEITADAAEKFLARPGNRTLFDNREPLTVIVVGHLSYNGAFEELGPEAWKPQQIIGIISDIVGRRGGQAILVSSPRSCPRDVDGLVEALGPRLAKSYLWHAKGNRGLDNLFEASFGIGKLLNREMEAVITADSMSMTGDGVSAEVSMRLVHAYGERECPAKRLTQNLIRHGFKANNDDLTIIPPPRFDTGLPSAVGAICEHMTYRAGVIEAARLAS